MAVKIGSGDDNPATDSCCVADKVVCGISASLFGMDFLSAGQCGVGSGGAFVSDAAVAGDRSTSNADRRFMIPQVVGGVVVGRTKDQILSERKDLYIAQ